jgi:small-conductance mechanosensitive channel
MFGVLLTLLFVVTGSGWATAQTVSAEVAEPVREGEPVAAETLDYESWDKVAQRAEAIMLRNVASRFTLIRLRAELVEWRDVFSGQLDKNERRLATITQQIAALGDAPADGEEESDAVAARRATLQSMNDEILAPRVLVNEAYARADGLISETDRLLRARQAEDFVERSASPLNPVYWSTALMDLWNGFRDLGSETRSAFNADVASGDALRKLPMTLLYFAIAYFLILRVRAWLALRYVTSENALSASALSIGQIVAMLIGLGALMLAVVTLDLPGVRSGALVTMLPLSGAVIIVGHWLAAQFFPVSPLVGPLGYTEATRNSARWYGMALSWVTGLWLPLNALLESGGISAESNAVLSLPVFVILGFLLFRLGRLFQHPPAEDLPDNVFQQGYLRKLVGRFCVIVAIASPVLAAIGYAVAAESLILPTILSLAVLGIVIYLQKLVNDIYGIWAQSRGEKSETLVPVLIGFILLALSIPLLALIWGASWADMSEIWTRFREGFAVGETRLSPTDFMTFVLIFVVGYMLTRLIQGALKRSVLPRTRLDLGGQNAVVAGFGYVGIGLAAIVAVTSAGIDLSNLAIVAGALSVGIGFGLQNIVSNFVSGIILLIERPVSEGDWIEVGGQMGYVRNISVRSTRIETFDRTDVIIPNADLVSGQVTNWTRGNLVGRVIVPVGVAYGTDPERVKEVLQEIAEAHPMVMMTPPPYVVFSAFGASSLDFELRAILRDVNFVLSVKSEMNFEIAKRFAAEGIEIPFPQTDLWLRNPEALQPNKT